MPYYAAMATAGSVAGCLVIYGIARKGGDALVRRRFHGRTLDRATRLMQKYGVFSLVVPAILPPPAPFKVFVLLAGVTGIRPLPFAVSIAIGRGFRYFAVGLLSVWYGHHAVTFLQENGATVALWAAGIVTLAIAGWMLFRHLRRREPALTSAG